MTTAPAYRARITVTLRKSILDPQGKAIHHALESLGLAGVGDVRIGKYIEMTLTSPSKAEAERAAGEACSRLLANPVMEDYSFTIEEV